MKNISFSNFYETPDLIKQEIKIDEKVIGLHFTAHFKKLKMLASGTGESEELALRKVYAEACERVLFLDQSVDRQAWCFDKLNSTDCMAGGFSLEKTIERSNLEAVERYIRLLLKEKAISLSEKHDVISTPIFAALNLHFSDIRILKSDVIYLDYSNQRKTCVFIMAIGIWDNNQVIGYSVSLREDKAIDHAIVELLRNKNICLLGEEIPEDFVNKAHYRKIKENSEELVKRSSYLKAIISGKGNESVYLPKISWQRVERVYDAFVCRSFVDGYLGDTHLRSEIL